MSGKTEQKIRLLISAHHKLMAQVIFYNVQEQSSPDTITPEVCAYILRVKALLDGIDGLMLLVPEEERYILELHLKNRMKWDSVKVEYEKRWPYDAGLNTRTYQFRQQGAIRKMCHYIERYQNQFDFSWLDDPMITEMSIK